MIIKSVETSPFKSIRFRFKAIILTLMAIGLAFTSLVSGAYFHKTGLFSDYLTRPILTALDLNAPAKYFNAAFEEIPTLTIHINFKRYQKLLKTRNLALEKGTIHDVENKYQKAEIEYDGQFIPIKIRLKGGFAEDHLKRDRMSLRIEVRGNNTLLGMRKFALMDPAARGYVQTPLYRDVISDQGLITKKYSFANVILNGKKLGVYAVDEHFSKSVMERNELKQSVFIKFNQTEYFKAILRDEAIPEVDGEGYFWSADITAVGSKEVEADPVAKKQFSHGKKLLEGLQRGTLSPSDVFDITKLAKLVALADVFGAVHKFSWINLRFYYNPLSSKLEMVSDDEYGEYPPLFDEPIQFHESFQHGEFIRIAFSDELFTKKYFSYLEAYSSEAFLPSVYNKFSDSLIRQQNIVRKNEPDYIYIGAYPSSYKYARKYLGVNLYGKYMHFEVLKKRAAYIRAVLSTIDIAGLHSITRNKDYLEAIVFVDGQLPIEFEELRVDTNHTLPIHDIQKVNHLRPPSSPMEYFKVRFRHNGLEQAAINDASLVLRVSGTKRSTPLPLAESFNALKNNVTNDIVRLEENSLAFTSIEHDARSKQIRFKKGEHIIDRDLVIGQGWQVFVEPGAKIDLINDAMIFSRSSMKFQGTQDNPIEILTSDNSGQGVTIFDDPEPSEFTHVDAEGLSAPQRSGWALSGAINVYNTDVQIRNSMFSKNKIGDDLLNIIESNFSISDTVVFKAAADAIDFDFSKGSIKNSVFKNVGVNDDNGDALDFSGSHVQLSNINISHVADKGLSVGEASQVKISNLLIENAETCIAVKDNSKLEGQSVRLIKCKQGIAAFNKKKGFSGAQVTLSNVEVIESETPYFVEGKSSVIIDSKKINVNVENARDILY